MTSYRPFDIVLVPFPFTDLTTHKMRPALILSRISGNPFGSNLYICSMVTSQIHGKKLLGDVLIQKWQKAQLLYPSQVRLAKIVTVEEKLLRRKLGRLQPGDKSSLRTQFKKLFSELV